jgi:hypothetical protein
MPNETSSTANDSGFDYTRAVQKKEDLFLPKFLHINRLVNRPAAALLVRAVYRTSITPNQMTVASFFIGLSGAACLAAGRPPWFLVGGLLAQFASIVDCADGMLARAKDQVSEFGGSLDLVLDRFNEFFLLVAAILGHFRWTGHVPDLVLGLLALGFYFLQTTEFYLIKGLLHDDRRGEAGEIHGWLMFLIGFFSVIHRIDWGIYVLLASALIGNTGLILRFVRSRKG